MPQSHCPSCASPQVKWRAVASADAVACDYYRCQACGYVWNVPKNRPDASHPAGHSAGPTQGENLRCLARLQFHISLARVDDRFRRGSSLRVETSSGPRGTLESDSAYSRYSQPDLLELKEVDKPVPRDNEVLIAIHATTVSTGDCNMRNFTFVTGSIFSFRQTHVRDREALESTRSRNRVGR